MPAIESFTVNGFTIQIHPDHDAEEPFGDGIEVYYPKRSRYRTGTKAATDSELRRLDESARDGKVWGFPVYAYIHSGTALSTNPFQCPWDSGRSGLAIVEKGLFATESEAREAVDVFLENLTTYINGRCVGYIIRDPHGEEVDSCWGFYDYAYCKQAATDAALLMKVETETETN